MENKLGRGEHLLTAAQHQFERRCPGVRRGWASQGGKGPWWDLTLTLKWGCIQRCL